MAQFDIPQIGYLLNINGEYHNTLDIEGFSQMMKDPSYCYKFYWLEAIVDIISEGTQDTTFDAIIDEMICNAWYSVREFHIHLSGMQADGLVRDGLERAVLKLTELSDLPANASKVEIKNAIREHNADLKLAKEQLTNMVPGRALAGFFSKSAEEVPWRSIRRLTEYIRWIDSTVIRLPYTFGDSSKLKKEIYFNSDWMRMIQDNTVNILGWIQYEKVKWLQNNNPEVPGLIYKLAPMDEKMRKLNNVRKLWEGILDVREVRDVFTGNPIATKQYDVDHFIPWSFVMNDELWNLMPMDSSLNSSKSNKLPKWDPFFITFAANQYSMYLLIHEREELHKRFEACYRDNLHSIWAGQELYRPGNTKEEFYNILQKNMQPVYDSARRQGYEIWNFS
ncbi:MAG: HNH endonuclease domain-containing protein [Lachnospiraceae bacterium]|nr:HNH endonuclease domain-containing protein [Lachnospiraceae bacterium]